MHAERSDRNVPEDIHEALVRCPGSAGQSRQQFLAAQLGVIAATPTLDEMLDRKGGEPSQGSALMTGCP
jgi:hypothetical protein